MRMTILLAGAAASFGLAMSVSSVAHASILTFDGNICNAPGGVCSNYGFISQNYGDTAGVDVQYNRDVLNVGFSRGATGSELEWWDADYNDLSHVAWGGAGDCCGTPEIFLASVGGATVTLNGFDLGAYPDTVRGTQITLINGLNQVLYSSGPINVGAGNVHSHFNFNISSNTGIGVQWGPSGYNVGIDNLEFNSSGGAVPEPTTWALMLSGFGLAGAVLRRRRGQVAHAV